MQKVDWGKSEFEKPYISAKRILMYAMRRTIDKTNIAAYVLATRRSVTSRWFRKWLTKMISKKLVIKIMKVILMRLIIVKDASGNMLN